MTPVRVRGREFDRRFVILASLVLLLGIGGAAYAAQGAGDGGGDTMIDWTFAVPPQMYIQTWALEQGQVELPENVEMNLVSTPEKSFTRMVSGEEAVGIHSVVNLPLLKERNPSLRITGFARFPRKTFTLYAAEGSGIDTLKDLEGENVVLSPQTTSGVLTLLALEKEGVNLSRVTVQQKPLSTAIPLLQQGEVAAAMAVGYPGDGFRPLLRPIGYWEQHYGNPVPVSAVVASEPALTDTAWEIAETLERSHRLGAENIDEVVATQEEETGMNNSRSFRMMRNFSSIRPSDDVVTSLQDLLDRAYDAGYLDREVDVAAMVVDDTANG